MNRDQQSSQENESEESLSSGEFVLEMVKVFLLAAAIIIPVRVFLFQPFFVQGSSMEPNFEDGEYLVINEFGYKNTRVGVGEDPLFTVESFKELSRQESVVFRSPVKSGQFLIKRVIALPGETIEIRSSKVIIRNEAHPEGFILSEREYLAATVFTSDMKPVTLGSDEYFVLGDNRTASYDSRSIGPIKKDLIVGRVSFRAWPLSRVEAY